MYTYLTPIVSDNLVKYFEISLRVNSLGQFRVLSIVYVVSSREWFVAFSRVDTCTDYSAFESFC